MFKWIILFLLWFVVPAAAQNPTCPTRPPGTSDNSCASTAFVQNAASGFQPVLPNFTANNPLIGNGTNVPVQGTRSGGGTQFGTVTGTPVNGNCASWNAGSLADAGAPCGAGGGGSGTVSSGTAGQFAVYPSNGTTVGGVNLFYANVSCNGVTDVSAAINTALTAATGGILILPAGICIITANTIAVPSNTVLMGQGSQSTVLTTASTTQNVLTQASGSRVTNIGFNSSVTRTAGVYDVMGAGSMSFLDNFWMNNGFIDITMGGINTASFGTIQNETPNATSAGSGGIVVNTSAATFISNVLHRMDTNTPSAQPFFSLELINGSLDCTSCDFLQSLHAINDSPGNGQVTFLRATASHWDTVFGDAVVVEPRTGGTAAVTNLTGVWIAPNCSACNGITIATSGGTVENVTLVNDTFQAYSSGTGAGINLTTSPSVSLQAVGNTIGLTGAFFQWGFLADGGVNNFQVVGNSVPFCTTHSYEVGTGSSNNYMITNNVRGLTCGAVSDGGSGAFKLVNNNL